MSVARRQLNRDELARLAAELSPPPPDPAIASRVAGVLADVRARGDAALVEFTQQFDCATFRPDQLVVPAETLAAAGAALAPELRRAIEVAADQVRVLATASCPDDRSARLPAGQEIAVRNVPVDAAGVYVPGGRAAYPSSLVMAVVPAQVAGVPRIAVTTPPTDDGVPHRVILGAAAILGVHEVYAVGGPGAIGALAFGTDSVAPVSVIAGPGSAWVQEAKRQVFGTVGIDGIAGPSELVVVADGVADADEIAADLLGQAEHGTDSPAILVSPDAGLVERVERAVGDDPATRSITLVTCATLEDAMAFVDTFAPEHLQLQVADARHLANSVRHAGAVFVGANGGTAFGDYVAGSNHILPTGGAARFASSVAAATFMRRMAIVDLPDAAVTELTPHLAAIADAEGFVNHRRSAEVRAARIARQGGSQ